jgi:hypothetical protein
MWNLSNRMLACGAVALGGIAKRLPHIHHRQLNAPPLLRSEPGEELVHADFRPVRAAEPDRAHPIQIADYDPVGVPLADRDLVDANSAGGRGPDAAQLRAHVLLLQALDGAPIEMPLLGDILDRGHSAAAGPPRTRTASCRTDGRPASPGLPASPCHTGGTAPAAPPAPSKSAYRHTPDRPPTGAGDRRTPMGFPADTTRRFFRRRTSCTMRTCGSPTYRARWPTAGSPGSDTHPAIVFACASPFHAKFLRLNKAPKPLSRAA